MRRRRFVALLCTGSATALAGCIGGDDGGSDGDPTPESTPESTPSPDPTPEPTPTETPTPEPTPTETPTSTETPATPAPMPQINPDPVTVEGSGDSTTDPVELEGGMTVVEGEHAGDDGWTVHLRDGGELVVDGDASGVLWAGNLEGEVAFEVEASGDWSLTVRQPRAEAGRPVESLEGDSTGKIFPVLFDSPTDIQATHHGDGGFLVEALALDGTRRPNSTLFQETGSFDGETTFEASGSAWIVVRATGDWQLSFQPA